MGLNIKNLTKLRNHIANLPPERLDMRTWSAKIGSPTSTVPTESLLHDCGTCGCLGGWTDALFPSDPRDRARAGSVLGLTLLQEDQLFFPQSLGVAQYADIDTQRAVKTLDTLIETGVVRWN